MRVAVACDWFLKYAVAQAAALERAGADTALVCRSHAHEFAGCAEERERALDEARAAGVDVFAIDGRSASPRPAVGLARRLARWRPDIVHAHDNHDPRLLFACTRYPRVVTVHDPTPHPGANRLDGTRTAIRRWWIRGANRIVVHGDALRTELAASLATPPIVVIPHGAAPSPAPVPRPARPCVLFFGRLEAYKGLDVLGDAIGLVWQERPDVRLLVVGNGPEADRLPDDARIERSVGYVPESEVDDAFRRASLVVLPYVQASQSGVGMLALARGIPTVVTDVGSLPDLALDSSYVVPPNAPRELAVAILRHLDHDDAARAAALARARSEFSWDVVARRSLALYAEVLR